MIRLRKDILMGFVSLLISACQKLGLNNEWIINRLTIGETTQDQVLQKAGNPDSQRYAENGTLIWEFPLGPSGVRTYMLTFDSKGILQKIEQVLNEIYFRRITPGMNKQTVRELLGRPRTMITYDLSHHEVWDWLFESAQLETQLFVITFDQHGKVLKTEIMNDPAKQNG